MAKTNTARSGEMKVTFVIPSIDFGGAEIQLLWQIEGLTKRGYQVFLIVLGGINENYSKLPVQKEHLLYLDATEKDLTGKATLGALKFIPSIAAFIKQHELNIVVAILPFAHFVMRMVFVFLKIKGYRINLYNYHHSLQFEESPLNTVSKRIFNLGNSYLARFTDSKSIFISQAVQENIKANSYAPNPIILLNGVPEKEVNFELAENYLAEINRADSAFKIVLPGRLNETKGQLFFIDAFATFVKNNKITHQEIQVILAGGGKLLEEIKGAIKQNGLDEYFYITGFIPNELLLSFLKIADLVVIPSLVEGLGNVAIETLMMGSIVLASDAGGLKEIIVEGENGFSFKKNNKNDLIRQLDYLYFNRNVALLEKKKIIEDYQTRFSFESHINKLIDVLNSYAK